jgi:hypothetical protein
MGSTVGGEEMKKIIWGEEDQSRLLVYTWR